MKYSICIETIFTEQPFMDRIKSVKDAGFDYCEFWTWKSKNADEIFKTCEKYGVKIASFSGDDEYSMINPDENKSYIDFVKQSIDVVKQLGSSYLVIHSDALCNDGSAKKIDKELSHDEKVVNLYEVLKTLAPVAEAAKVCLVLEPLNTLVDHKGYFLDNSQTSFDLIRSVGSDYIKVLYDVYHMQIMEGNVIENIENNLEHIAYIHIADVPGRHEPGTGELNYDNIIKALKGLGYDGFVGFELEPQDGSSIAISRIKNVL